MEVLLIVLNFFLFAYIIYTNKKKNKGETNSFAPTNNVNLPNVIELRSATPDRKPSTSTRQTLKFNFQDRQIEVNAIIEHREESRVEAIAASYISDKPDNIERLRMMIATKERYASQCALRDEKGNMVPGDRPGMFMLDTNNQVYSVYRYFRNIIDSCYFYAKFKILLVNAPEDFNIDTISTEEFNELRSAYEVALESFRTSARAA